VHDSRRTRLGLGLLLVAALALITFNPQVGATSLVRTISGAAESVISSITRPVKGFFTSLGSTSASQAKIAGLERQVLRLHAELWFARQTRTDWTQLQSLLQLAGRGRYRIAVATVISASPTAATVVIDAGRADRIKPEETVLNGAGLVGVVSSVGAETSTVLLATDTSIKVGVRIAGTKHIGVVGGLGRSEPGLLRLQALEMGTVLQAGEQLVTFGGWPYAPGVPVGVITRVEASGNPLTESAYVRPFANDGALDVVGVVIAPPRRNPGDAVLPTPPASQSGT
jgi:rod shape-determining protein MreC